MPAATKIDTGSLAKKSRILMASHSGAILKVASVTATEVTVDSAAALTGTSLYSASKPGQLVIVEGVAAGDKGATANITGIAGAVLTVSVDLTTKLADGDFIAVLPPLSVELLPPQNSPHTLAVEMNVDESRSLTDVFDYQNTLDTLAIRGAVNNFATIDSAAFGRLLMFGIGGYEKTGVGQHDYVPVEDIDTGSYVESDEASFYLQEGDGTVRWATFGMFSTGLTIDIPQSGSSTVTVDTIGSGAVREVGGAGRTFTTGANNWVRTGLKCDTGSRFPGVGAFVELGGAFGDDLTDAAETLVQNVNIRYERGAIEDRALGNKWPLKAEEESGRLTITGTRILGDDSFFEKAWGDANSAEPEQKAETRMLIKAISPKDATKTLTLDTPRGYFIADTPTFNRQTGRFTQPFTFRALHTLDGDGCISAVTPLFRARYVNGDDVDYNAVA